MSCEKFEKTKKDGSVKVAEVNRNILGVLNSYSLKTGKPGDFKKAVLFPFSGNFKHLQPRWKSSTYSKEQIKRYFTARPRRSQYLQGHSIVVDMITIINTTLPNRQHTLDLQNYL